jgi:ABC-type transport system substrate-binding protein
LTFPTAYVVDKNNVERGGRTWTDRPNGTGPFKLKEYVRGQRIILAKNPDFYLEPKASIDEIEFILGGGSLMTMYENGDIEAARVSISDIERVTDPSSPLNKELYQGPELSTCYLVFNTNKPPFDDPQVRKAIGLAINRQQIIDVVFKKMGIPANSIMPPGMPGYTDTLPKPVYDPAQAKQALAQSKYAGKLPDIVWTTTGGGGAASQDIQAMTGMLRENLGITVEIQQTDWATFIGQLNDPARNPYQMFDICWIADYADPQNFIDVLFRTGSVQNWAAYSNPEVDKLIDQAGLERDTANRFKLYQQAEQMILADNAVVPMHYQQQFWVTKPYVKGMVYPPIVIPRYRYATISK